MKSVIKWIEIIKNSENLSDIKPARSRIEDKTKTNGIGEVKSKYWLGDDDSMIDMDKVVENWKKYERFLDDLVAELQKQNNKMGLWIWLENGRGWL
ncbi:hypothetical protein CCY99_08770 [Helicobacter sp. 16-1353]|uniref:hypothetical protein n=1 Tax=Helicobacter sp. 16-1353 TaxID=2004996 RepID=UPI000DCE1335|nr:hypothetical protein [Helicobacter sp. 16-1353]RAX51642.1 hypothetical protein CCY99_08770 [Helicobacter sp. 16-1353]